MELIKEQPQGMTQEYLPHRREERQGSQQQR
jgi:hypothetical protein